MMGINSASTVKGLGIPSEVGGASTKQQEGLLRKKEGKKKNRKI